MRSQAAGSAGRRLARWGLGFTWLALTVAACSSSTSTLPSASNGNDASSGGDATPLAGASDTGASDTGGGSTGGGSTGGGSTGGTSKSGAGGTAGGGGHGGAAGGGGHSGTGGSGGHGGTAGGGGHSGTAGGGKLGAACGSDAECQEVGTALKCVKATDTVLGGGAPPHGLCTLACQSDDDCAALSSGALCYPFGSVDNSGYCVEGCSFGSPNLGEAKCHSRPELACDPTLLGPTNAACDVTADCQQGELCLGGVCNVVFTGCLPACRGDIDCDPGTYCDQAFLSGVCLKKKPTGKALGEPCTVPAASAPAEPDECLGFCQADAANGVQGHCSTTCGIGNECSWNTATQRYDGLCLYASVLTADSGDVGDFGFCTPSCNCSADCNNSALACSALQQGLLPTDSFRGAGLCFSLDAANQEYNHCAALGAGGATGAGGAAGAGGAP